MNTAIEIWKPLQGFEGQYLISNQGRLKSISRIVKRANNKKLPLKERLIPGTIAKTGYRYTTLTDRKKYLYHRLVAITFLPKDSERTYVNHKDGNKDNNHVDNLEWCTAKENTTHAITTGLLMIKGAENVCAKLTEQQIVEIHDLRNQGLTYQKIAELYNMDQSTIGKILRGKLWKHVINSVILAVLLLTSSNLFAQTGDSLTCYTNEELIHIASKIVYANECEEYLAVADSQLIVQRQQLATMDQFIIRQNQLINVKDSLITNWKTVADNTQKELDSTKKKLWWAKLGLGSSTVLLIVSLFLNAL